MVGNCIKNFFKNLIYVFVPMGIVYLFFLIAGFVAVGSLVDIAKSAFTQASALIRDSVGESTASVNAFLHYAFDQLKWEGSLIGMIVNAFRTHWLSNTIKGFFGTLAQTSEGFAEQVDLIMSDFTARLRALISGVAVLCVIGIVAANYLTRLVIRKRTAKRKLTKALLAYTVVPLVQALFVVASVAVLFLLRYYGLLVVAALIVISCAFSLTASWIVHRSGGLRLKDVVTVKNILLHLASIGAILLINIVLAVALFFLNVLFAILIMIPFILYSMNIIGTNTDSMVCKMIEDRRRAAEGAAAAVADEGATGAAAVETAAAEEGAEPSPEEGKEN